MSKYKIFTVEEARRVLPLVKSIVRDIRSAWKAASDDPLGADLLHGKRLFSELTQEEMDHLLKLDANVTSYIKELEELGVLLKSPETGLVDFLSRREGELIQLCWMDGEDDIEHWHRMEDGFAGRVRLDAETTVPSEMQ